MSTIQALCQKTVWLDKGRVLEIGPTKEVVHRYLELETLSEAIPLDKRSDREGNGKVRICSIQIQDEHGTSVIRMNSRLKITVEYTSEQPVKFLQIYVSIYDMRRTGIFTLDSDLVGGLPERLPQQGVLTCLTDPINLTPGRCYASVALYKGEETIDRVGQAAYFDVVDNDFYESGKTPQRNYMLCTIRYQWLGGESSYEHSNALLERKSNFP